MTNAEIEEHDGDIVLFIQGGKTQWNGTGCNAYLFNPNKGTLIVST